MTLHLDISLPDSVLVRPLLDGTVKPEGIHLESVGTGGGVVFYRNLKFDEFDISEMSISATFIARDRTDGSRWDWAALPVLLGSNSGWFRFYANAGSGIKDLGDIRGKRVAFPDYDSTDAMLFKLTLKELYGIDVTENTWYTSRLKELTFRGAMGFEEEPRPGLDLRWLSEDQTPDAMVESGELDACFLYIQPHYEGYLGFTLDRYGGTPLTDNPRLRRLVPDRGKDVVTRFYQKTGSRQPSHHIIIQNRVLRKHPWVALELVRAFQRAKEVAYERARAQLSGYFLFEGGDRDEQCGVFGEDPYPFGVRANRRTLEVMLQAALDQGLIRKPLRIEDVYYGTTMDT